MSLEIGQWSHMQKIHMECKVRLGRCVEAPLFVHACVVRPKSTALKFHNWIKNSKLFGKTWKSSIHRKAFARHSLLHTRTWLWWMRRTLDARTVFLLCEVTRFWQRNTKNIDGPLCVCVRLLCDVAVYSNSFDQSPYMAECFCPWGLMLLPAQSTLNPIKCCDVRTKMMIQKWEIHRNIQGMFGWCHHGQRASIRGLTWLKNTISWWHW